MTVRMADDGVIALEGDCPLEDAEVLLRRLLVSDNPRVDWRQCDSAHTAVIQVLFVGRPTLTGPPRGPFLKRWLAKPLETANA